MNETRLTAFERVNLSCLHRRLHANRTLTVMTIALMLNRLNNTETHYVNVIVNVRHHEVNNERDLFSKYPLLFYSN